MSSITEIKNICINCLDALAKDKKFENPSDQQKFDSRIQGLKHCNCEPVELENGNPVYKIEPCFICEDEAGHRYGYSFKQYNQKFTLSRIDNYPDQFEQVSDSVEIDGQNSTRAVWYDKVNSRFIAVATLFDPYDIYYEITKPFEEIKELHRDELLKCTLARYTKEDDITYGDIFMHGGFIKRIN
ncbi:hypothetical protein OAH77_04485 [Flavobacteriaceae bacterium]|nr:hypothetical protein [Flavobacteriaceae bacterium]